MIGKSARSRKRRAPGLAYGIWIVAFAATMSVHRAGAVVPDHPIITEVFNDPRGADGPTGRDLTNLDQEFVEIYLPTAGDLAPSMNKDALRLTFLEIEGDADNLEEGHVSQRIDLPPVDVDPSNGTTPGSLPRPAGGVVVLGWVDYNTLDPPTALAGTSSTRVALIDGGITTSPPGALFIAVNGNQFGGSFNFPTPSAESFIDIPNENHSGILRNGSNAYLLLNRDDAGYAVLHDRQHPEFGPSDAALPTGNVIQLSALLDGLAGNDDPLFLPNDQPLVPSGIDLDAVLPAGGVFSPWIAQVAEESGGGYARRFVDRLKTTENTTFGDEDPALDAHDAYRLVYRDGPFLATPGTVVFSSDAPALGISAASRLVFDVIAGTTGRPGLLCANVGGDFPIEIFATPGISSNEAVAAFSESLPAHAVAGQTFGYPQIAVDVPAGAPNGAVVTAPATFNASNTEPSDPRVQDPSGVSSVQCTVVNPSFGLDSYGLPYQATVFAAIEGIGSQPDQLNELAASDLGTFTQSHLGRTVLASLGHADDLLATQTNLEDLATVRALRAEFPTDESDFINAAGPAGALDLAYTVALSPKNILVPAAYLGTFNLSSTAVRAVEIPIPETLTSGGVFSPTDFVFFVDAIGSPFDRRDGLGWATTLRTFELAIIDTNVTETGIESGTADDFGLVVEVGRTGPAATVQTGEFVFLSYTGGLAGEDIDGMDVPGDNATVAVLFDLDNLNSVLGCETITRLFIVDAAGADVLDPLEVLSLNPRCAAEGGCPFYGDGNRDGLVNRADEAPMIRCLAGPDQPLRADSCIVSDFDLDGDVDLLDYSRFLRSR